MAILSCGWAIFFNDLPLETGRIFFAPEIRMEIRMKFP